MSVSRPDKHVAPEDLATNLDIAAPITGLDPPAKLPAIMRHPLLTGIGVEGSIGPVAYRDSPSSPWLKTFFSTTRDVGKRLFQWRQGVPVCSAHSPSFTVNCASEWHAPGFKEVLPINLGRFVAASNHGVYHFTRATHDTAHLRKATRDASNLLRHMYLPLHAVQRRIAFFYVHVVKSREEANLILALIHRFSLGDASLPRLHAKTPSPFLLEINSGTGRTPVHLSISHEHVEKSRLYWMTWYVPSSFQKALPTTVLHEFVNQGYESIRSCVQASLLPETEETRFTSVRVQEFARLNDNDLFRRCGFHVEKMATFETSVYLRKLMPTEVFRALEGPHGPSLRYAKRLQKFVVRGIAYRFSQPIELEVFVGNEHGNKFYRCITPSCGPSVAERFAVRAKSSQAAEKRWKTNFHTLYQLLRQTQFGNMSPIDHKVWTALFPVLTVTNLESPKTIESSEIGKLVAVNLNEVVIHWLDGRPEETVSKHCLPELSESDLDPPKIWRADVIRHFHTDALSKIVRISSFPIPADRSDAELIEHWKMFPSSNNLPSWQIFMNPQNLPEG